MLRLSKVIMENCLLGSILISKWNHTHQSNKYVVLKNWEPDDELWRVELAHIDVISNGQKGKLLYWEEVPYKIEHPSTIMYIDKSGTCLNDGRKYQIWHGKPVKCRKMVR